MSKKYKDLFISKNHNKYIIAEIGNNHNGSINLAKKLIVQAKRSGADCVKFQTFSTTSLFSKKSLIRNKKLKSDSDKYTLKLNSFKLLKEFSLKHKIDFTATPFSKSEVDFLVDKLNLKFVKIASMDLNNYPLLHLNTWEGIGIQTIFPQGYQYHGFGIHGLGITSQVNTSALIILVIFSIYYTSANHKYRAKL